MSISFATLTVKHERRVRLYFTHALAAGAFTTLSLYALLNDDGFGVSPNIVAAYLVPNSANAVELALDADLVQGSRYELTATGVPATDLTTSPAETQAFTWGEQPSQPNQEQPQNDLAALIYGSDLVWTGDDYLETQAGDLATIEGIPNVEGALLRRLTNQFQLPWAPSYGARPEDFVEGPTGNAITLLGALRRQAVADDRVASATVSFVADPKNGGDAFFPASIILRGTANNDQPVTLAIAAP
jgi:hypothetical protein